MTLAWHFVAGPPPRLLDGRPVVIGETLHYDGPLVLCAAGYHASKRAIDALSYAPGSILCRVRVGDDLLVGVDKLVARERTPVAIANVTREVHEFALWCAAGALIGAGVEDARCWRALRVKRAWLDGRATGVELTRARRTARAVARTQRVSALDATWAAAWAVDRNVLGAAFAAACAGGWAAGRGVRAAARIAIGEEFERRMLAAVGEGATQ